jgi:hypothetical protein
MQVRHTNIVKRNTARSNNTPLMNRGMLPIVTLASWLLGADENGAKVDIRPAATCHKPW